MQMVYNRSIFLDKQLMKTQENPNEIPEGETPHTVSMFARQVGEGNGSRNRVQPMLVQHQPVVPCLACLTFLPETSALPSFLRLVSGRI